MKHPLFGIALIATLVAASVSHAATLGRAKVVSYLNQPLDVQIDLVGVATGEHLDLRLRVANQEHFDRLGITYLPIHRQMQFDIVQIDGRWVARARTQNPVSDPFVDFPLQLSWPGGRLVKQYSLLLDPINLVKPTSVTRTATRKPARTQAQGTSETARPSSPDSNSYGPVRSGETLWPIAQRTKPRGISTHQMAVALVRANPHAFINGDMNRLRAGATLDIPTRTFIEQTDQATAREEFATQTRVRQPDVATSHRTLQGEAAPAEPTSPQAKPAVTPDADKTKSNAEAALRIVTRDTAEGGKTLENQLLATMEEIESNRLNTGAIETRLARLEDELARMQRLIELKDAQIVALESELAVHADNPPPSTVATPTVTVSPATLVEADLPVTEGDGSVVPVVAAAAPAPIAMPITSIERLPTPTQPSQTAPYDRYLWIVWMILGLLGLSALIMLWRRPSARAGVPMADLPEISNAPPRPYSNAALKTSGPIADDPRLQSDTQPIPSDFTASSLPLAELDISEMLDDTDESVEVADSLLQEMIDESKLLDTRPEPQQETTEQQEDDDIASWVADLRRESDYSDQNSANDEHIDADLDIPSILTELDDNLSGADAEQFSKKSGVQMEPAEDEVEDETFAMSLDLARAYLEIGDQDGARDMLKQALHGARSTNHRRQIEELLQQID